VRAVFTTVSVIVLVAGLVVFVSSRDGAKVADGSGPAVAPTGSAEQLYGPKIKLPPAARTTAQRFIQTAVLRNDVAAAWRLVTANERAGVTRAEWDMGNIPVVPFPQKGFSGAQFKIIRSRQRDVLIQVLLTSHTLGVKPTVDFLELVPSGGRWLVTYWAPQGQNPPLPSATP
jgi:hypothetical protein